MAMAKSLNVIALVSGGKDSFYSILHCIQNKHKVVALGNLYPLAPQAKPQPKENADNEETSEDEEQDLNSFMYQTVGHTVIPLYEAALEIPLYRQQITGSAIQTGTSYSHPTVPAAAGLLSETESQAENEDETESLIPLLERIKAKHPDANALSTGAILSTYQRTRVESVALRLGLTPLSFLWQYPILPPGIQASLLRDMQAVGFDARIVKVASGGLDERFLWENIASETGIRRVERSMKRFGVDGDGGVLGEGGEFETLVIDGPRSLFKGRIEIREEDRKVVREGGGSAWLRILDAKVVMKSPGATEEDCRVPDVLEQRFQNIFDSLENDSLAAKIANSTSRLGVVTPFSNLDIVDAKSSGLSSLISSRDNMLYWTVTGRGKDPRQSASDEATEAILKIRQLLGQASLEPSSIVSTTIVLRSMQDFNSVNSVFPPPDPLLYLFTNKLIDLWRAFHSSQSTFAGNHLLRFVITQGHQHPNIPQNIHLAALALPSKGTPCTIAILLGACKHWTVLSSNIFPNFLNLRHRDKHLRRFHSRADTTHPSHYDTSTSIIQLQPSRKFQVSDSVIASTSLPHRGRYVSVLAHRNRRLPTLITKPIHQRTSLLLYPRKDSRTSMDGHPLPATIRRLIRFRLCRRQSSRSVGGETLCWAWLHGSEHRKEDVA